MDKNQYKPYYGNYFGGVVSFARRHFQQINGFSNVYWGWDDDLGARVRTKLGKPGRMPFDIGRYTMVKHNRDPSNPTNPKRHELAKNAAQRMEIDGLSNVNYTVLHSELRPLYTWILVDLGKPP